MINLTFPLSLVVYQMPKPYRAEGWAKRSALMPPVVWNGTTPLELKFKPGVPFYVGVYLEGRMISCQHSGPLQADWTLRLEPLEIEGQIVGNAIRRGPELNAIQEAVRTEVARLHYARGCGCCGSEEKWNLASERLARMLGVPEYSDRSGWDWFSIYENEGKPDNAQTQ